MGSVDYMDYTEWFYQRLTALRMEKGVSARDMSLSLGQSESYINKIENRRTMPSMAGFFYICEYFNITPQEFFDSELRAPQKGKELQRELGKLTPQQAEHILQVVKDLTQK
ncbi:MAG: helix-turn-helix domain-containing protein [Oscillospiraceae bacterium]